MVQKKLQKKIRAKAEKLEHQIVHVSLPEEGAAKIKKSQSNRLSNNEMQLEVRRAQIKLKQAQQLVEAAEKQGSAHRNIWETSNGGLWNPNLFCRQTPSSSYGQQFQDPRRVLEA